MGGQKPQTDMQGSWKWSWWWIHDHDKYDDDDDDDDDCSKFVRFRRFKKSFYSDVNSLLCSETSREASPAKQQIYQVLYICLSFICFWEENWATNIPYMINMATNQKHIRRSSLQVPLQVEERAPVPEPDSKIQSSFQNSDLRNSESRVRSSSELGTRSSESSSQQTYSSVQVILSFWWDHWRWKLFSSHLSWKPKLL